MIKSLFYIGTYGIVLSIALIFASAVMKVRSSPNARRTFFTGLYLFLACTVIIMIFMINGKTNV